MTPAFRARLIFVIVAGCALAAYGGFTGNLLLMNLGIILAPLMFMRRR